MRYLESRRHNLCSNAYADIAGEALVGVLFRTAWGRQGWAEDTRTAHLFALEQVASNETLSSNKTLE